MLSAEELAALNPEDNSSLDSAEVNQTLTDSLSTANQLTDSPFKLNESLTHIMVLSMSLEEAAQAEGLTGDLETFHAKNFSGSRLRIGNMNMNQENAIYIISPFNNVEKAKEYFVKFSEDFESSHLSQEIKEKSFFISIENFQILNKSKNIEEYLAFFRANYQ